MDGITRVMRTFRDIVGSKVTRDMENSDKKVYKTELNEKRSLMIRNLSSDIKITLFPFEILKDSI